MQTHPTSVVLFALTLGSAVAATSANYSTSPQVIDAGGLSAASANYTADGSVGGVAGVSTATSPDAIAKQGYAAQLYEVSKMTVDASPATINEGSTRQLSAQAILDDATLLALDPLEVAWSVLSGPLTGIDSAGVATAAIVYQTSAASVQGAWGGFTGTLDLSVLDTNPDNYGSYAGDGLADSWQQQYFGLNNPLAAPTADPDGDGQNNLLEFTAGTVPNNAASRFTLHIEEVPGSPQQKSLVFSPLVAGRSYTVLTSSGLSAATPWQTLSGTSVVDTGATRTVTDPAATAARRFYRVQISQP